MTSKEPCKLYDFSDGYDEYLDSLMDTPQEMIPEEVYFAIFGGNE